MFLSSDSDNKIYDQIRLSSRISFNQLFIKYYKGLSNFALTFLRVPQDAEEVVSDVFFNLWKGREKNEIVNIKAYLYTSVKHACLAELRKRKVQLKVDSLEANHQMVADEDQVSEDNVDKLVEAIENLPLRCKQVFLLSRFEGLKYKEISATLNISERTVENHLVSALARIRKELNQSKSTSITI